MLTVNNLDVSDVSEVSGRVSGATVRLIPGETERPKFIVFDDWHDEGGVKYRPGVWNFGLKNNKGDAPPTLTQ